MKIIRLSTESSVWDSIAAHLPDAPTGFLRSPLACDCSSQFENAVVRPRRQIELAHTQHDVTAQVLTILRQLAELPYLPHSIATYLFIIHSRNFGTAKPCQYDPAADLKSVFGILSLTHGHRCMVFGNHHNNHKGRDSSRRSIESLRKKSASLLP